MKSSILVQLAKAQDTLEDWLQYEDKLWNRVEQDTTNYNFVDDLSISSDATIRINLRKQNRNKIDSVSKIVLTKEDVDTISSFIFNIFLARAKENLQQAKQEFKEELVKDI